MSQTTTSNLEDYIQEQYKNNTNMVVRLNDGSIIFVDEQALDRCCPLPIRDPSTGLEEHSW